MQIYMEASLKLLTSARITKKGYPIIVEVFKNSKQRPRKTIGHSFKECWDEKSKEPLSNHPQYNELIPKVKDCNAIISKIRHRNYTFQESVDALINGNDDVKQREKGVISFLEDFIVEKKSQNIQSEHFESLRRELLRYIGESDMPINNITYEWLNEYKLYKITQTRCNEPGVMNYLKNLRTVYKEAQRRKSLSVKQDNPFLTLIKNFKKETVISFPPEKIKAFQNYKSTKKTISDEKIFLLNRRIAITMFQFYIGGHDYCDIPRLKWVNIKPKRRLVFKRYKNRNKPNGGPLVDNYLCNEAVNIIETYGNKKTERIFSYIPDLKTDYKGYALERHRHINELIAISKNINSERLTSKSMRYIFRTYAGELLTPDLIITRLQGHVSNSVSFNYQGAISNEVKDQLHQKIIDLVR